MNPFSDKDQPILLVILISIFSWKFNHYVDSLRVDTTLSAVMTTEPGDTCRTDTFTFENLSSKNGIANLTIAIAADKSPPPILQLCGQSLIRAVCLAFEPNTSVVTPGVVSLPVTFPMIYPERSCSIIVSVAKDSPPLKFFLLEKQAGDPATKVVDQTMHIVPDKVRIVENSAFQIWVIRNTRLIYFYLMGFVLAFMLIWLGIATMRLLFGLSRPPPTTPEAP